MVDDKAMLKAENENLMKQLAVLNEKLKESEAFKSHFISNVTNEIINPFTAILGISQSVLQLGAEDIGQIHSMVNLIYHEAFDLSFQLNNIFEAAEIEAGLVDLEITRVNLVELIGSEVEKFRFKAEKKSLYFEKSSGFPAELWFNTDVKKLRSVLVNLIDNSIKYSPEKQKISLKLKAENGLMVFSIVNHSVHLSEEDTLKMMDRFVKLNTDINSVNPGHGLGLAIAGSYLDILEGKIKIESPGNQVVVTIEIPENQVSTGVYDEDTDFFDDDIELF